MGDRAIYVVVGVREGGGGGEGRKEVEKGEGGNEDAAESSEGGGGFGAGGEEGGPVQGLIELEVMIFSLHISLTDNIKGEDFYR